MKNNFGKSDKKRGKEIQKSDIKSSRTNFAPRQTKKKPMNILEKLHLVLIKKGINNDNSNNHVPSGVEEGAIEKHILYNEYKNLFREAAIEKIEFRRDE